MKTVTKRLNAKDLLKEKAPKKISKLSTDIKNILDSDQQNTDNLNKQILENQMTTGQKLVDTLSVRLSKIETAKDYRIFINSIIMDITANECENVDQYSRAKKPAFQVLREINTFLKKNYTAQNPVDLSEDDSASQLRKKFKTDVKKAKVKTGAKTPESKKAIEIIRSKNKEINKITFELEQYEKDDPILFKTLIRSYGEVRNNILEADKMMDSQKPKVTRRKKTA